MPKKSAKVTRAGRDVIKDPRHVTKPPASSAYPDYDAVFRPEDAIVAEAPAVLQPSKLAYRDDASGFWLYHGDCLEVMDTLLAKYPGG